MKTEVHGRILASPPTHDSSLLPSPAPHRHLHRSHRRWYKRVWNYLFPKQTVRQIHIALIMIALAIALGISVALLAPH